MAVGAQPVDTDKQLALDLKVRSDEIQETVGKPEVTVIAFVDTKTRDARRDAMRRVKSAGIFVVDPD